ncbi:hypothetical protein BV25DRAFT_1477601 [Artomyces pyxidatus]|uniref:Uncharacterized protein n=1 Tax=Artomyces pyxidatus TaxID=48021 RepID=A0ACB8SK54_9AGAM|nr:hypothetical protein BV25DRAFT_1477601 [Artomyces pyxidatus]
MIICVACMQNKLPIPTLRQNSEKLMSEYSSATFRRRLLKPLGIPSYFSMQVMNDGFFVKTAVPWMSLDHEYARVPLSSFFCRPAIVFLDIFCIDLNTAFSGTDADHWEADRRSFSRVTNLPRAYRRASWDIDCTLEKLTDHIGFSGGGEAWILQRIYLVRAQHP